ELRSLEACHIGSVSDSPPGFLPTNRWLRCAGLTLHIHNTLCRHFKLVVPFDKFKRSDVISVVILPVMHESRLRLNPKLSLANVLAGKTARCQSDLIERMRNRCLVGVACGMRYMEQHAVLSYPCGSRCIDPPAQLTTTQ